MDKKHILAISGSTRQHSTNYHLIKTIELLTTERFHISFFDSINALPHFNPDFGDENIPKEVIEFRQKINEADGIIICTPEYAHGVPGTLKNAIDWTVSTNEFHHKPTVLITASTDGRFGQAALLETLKVLEARDIDLLNMLIQFARTKMNADNVITDQKTLIEISALLELFYRTICEKSELIEK